MAKLKSRISKATTPGGKEVWHVSLQGIISSLTVGVFRDMMAKPLKSPHDVLLDLSGISYINSSGLGEFVRIHDFLSQRNKSLLLINLDSDVGRLVKMLGLANVLYTFRDEDRALNALDKGLGGQRTEATVLGQEVQTRAKRRAGGFVPVVATPPPRLPDARILIGTNGDSRFAHFLGRCLSGHGGNAFIVHSLDEARKVADQGRVDIAILDSELKDSRNICQELKTRVGNGIMSVIFVYPSQEDRTPGDNLRVCEDEFTVEPFEVRELVALAQGEYARCRSESILFVQEACLEIATEEGAISQAGDILGKMIINSGLPTDDAEGFFYAIREAVDNARRHGNLSDPEKVIEVMYVLDKEKITVTVADDGNGFDWEGQIQQAKETSPIEQARERHTTGGFGGLGIGLMLRCCDKLEYSDPGKMCKLTKYL